WDYPKKMRKLFLNISAKWMALNNNADYESPGVLGFKTKKPVDQMSTGFFYDLITGALRIIRLRQNSWVSDGLPALHTGYSDRRTRPVHPVRPAARHPIPWRYCPDTRYPRCRSCWSRNRWLPSCGSD